MSTNQDLAKAKRLTSIGNFEQAEQLISCVLMRFPRNRSAQEHLVHLAKKRAEKLGPYVEIQTKHLTELANIFETDDYETSERISENLKQIYPEKFMIWFMDGVAKSRLGKYSVAFQSFEKALDIFPMHAELHYEIGRALQESGDNKNAFKSFHASKKLNPRDAKPDNALGMLYYKAEKWDKALEYFNAAIKSDSKAPEAYNNAALACNKLVKIEESCEYVQKALDLAPEVPQFLFNKAHTEMLKGDLKSAISIHENAKSLAIQQMNTDVLKQFSFNEALMRLANGDTSQGWSVYAERFDSINFPSVKREFEKPKLTSVEQANGKKILLWREQGLGDELMFLNLAKYFQELCECEIILEGSVRLMPVIRRSFPEADVRTPIYISEKNNFITTAKNFDYHIPYGDLPILLEMTKDSHEKIRPYLVSDSKLLEKWNELLPKGKIRIGLSWRSELLDGDRLIGYTQLEQWSKLIKNEKYSVVCLQYGDISADINKSSKEIVDRLYIPPIDLKNDMENLTCIMQNCDIVVAPGNAVLQHAGAAGVKTISYDRPDGPYFLGKKQTPLKSSRNPFIAKNHTICFTEKTKAQIPELVEKEIKKILDKKSC